TLQIKDFLGLPIPNMPEHYLEKISLLVQSIGQIHWPSLLVALFTLGVMLLWPRLKMPLPAHLPAVIVGSLVALLLNDIGLGVDTIYSRFSYIAADGSSAQG